MLREMCALRLAATPIPRARRATTVLCPRPKKSAYVARAASTLFAHRAARCSDSTAAAPRAQLHQLVIERSIARSLAAFEGHGEGYAAERPILQLQAPPTLHEAAAGRAGAMPSRNSEGDKRIAELLAAFNALGIGASLQVTSGLHARVDMNHVDDATNAPACVLEFNAMESTGEDITGGGWSCWRASNEHQPTSAAITFLAGRCFQSKAIVRLEVFLGRSRPISRIQVIWGDKIAFQRRPAEVRGA